MGTATGNPPAVSDFATEGRSEHGARLAHPKHPGIGRCGRGYSAPGARAFSSWLRVTIRGHPPQMAQVGCRERADPYAIRRAELRCRRECEGPHPDRDWRAMHQNGHHIDKPTADPKQPASRLPTAFPSVARVIIAKSRCRCQRQRPHAGD